MPDGRWKVAMMRFPAGSCRHGACRNNCQPHSAPSMSSFSTKRLNRTRANCLPYCAVKRCLWLATTDKSAPALRSFRSANIGRLRENFLKEFLIPDKSSQAPRFTISPRDVSRQVRHAEGAFPLHGADHSFLNAVLRRTSHSPSRSQSIERLDPPLIDILVEDGERRGKSKVNPPEAEVILDEIERIITDPHLANVAEGAGRPRSIGVISLIGSEQAAFIQKRLMDRVGEAAMVRHRIICGDSATFQGMNAISYSFDDRRSKAQAIANCRAIRTTL